MSRRCRWLRAPWRITTEPLGLSWPESIYSLSHVALPFPIDDPIYGGEGRGREMGSVSLGRLSPRGEKGALIVPEEVLMRLTWNPFFPYLASACSSWSRGATKSRASEMKTARGAAVFGECRHRQRAR